MASPNEKLAASLDELRRLQGDGSRVFASKQLKRTARERLLKHGFLQEVMKGWLISTSPAVQPKDTTPWFASFWEFCRRYCDERFAGDWHLSPDQSLLLQAENTVIPKQVIVYSPAANNNRIELLFDTSFFALKEKAMPLARDLEIRNGVRVYRVEPALLRVHERFFAQHPVEAQVVLGGIREPSELISRLLEGGHTVIAGRLAGAFRRVGQDASAGEIVAAMKAADHDVRETDPLDLEGTPAPGLRPSSPIVALIENEPAPSVRAVLGHWLFGYVHPFPDGNGRIARFVMNALLAGGGYPWTVIRVEDRTEYLAALEVASVEGDVRPFAKFVAHQVRSPIQSSPRASAPRRRRTKPRGRHRT